MSVLDDDTRRTLFRPAVQYVALPDSLVEATPSVHPAWARPQFLQRLRINAADFLLICHPRDLIHMELFRASGHLRERVPRITKRPDEESWSGRLADFKWSSLRI